MIDTKIERLVNGVVIAAFAYSAWAAQGFHPSASLYPRTIGLLGILACLMVFFSGRVDARLTQPGEAEREAAQEYWVSSARYLGWCLVLFGLVYIFGLIIGGTGFVVAFMSISGRDNWKAILVSCGLLLTLFFAIERFFFFTWPTGLLGNFFNERY